MTGIKELKIIFTLILTGIAAAIPAHLYSESVFMKNGSILEGKISGGDDFKITLSTSSDNISIERKDILRILVHERYRDRIYLTQTNGITLEGYIVNEDNIRITMRISLDSAEEINIPREKVETISLKKPSERLLPPSTYSSVFLKNGEIIDCRIVRETARLIDTKSLTGDRRIILRSDILRIQYNNSYKDKKVLKKYDGSRIEGYIMEEDSVSYTYRTELYSPVEEKIYKSELRSISRKQ